MKVEQFEDLMIWQKSRQLVGLIYGSFEADSPGGKDYGFRNQITRAAISVMNNIAEGFERNGDKEFAQFLSIAKASAGEVRSMIYAAEDLSYMDSVFAKMMRAEYRQLSCSISKLATYLRK